MSELDRIIRIPELVHLVGYSRPSIYRLMDSDEFPSAVKLGPQAVGWRMSEIQEWIASREKAV